MPNGECRYFLTDQVDSVNVVLNDKGDAITRTEYKPYGETWVQEGDKSNRPKFNSQELDVETGYYFYNARYYEAEIGRFITADNIIPEEYSTQSWNRFSYCKGNPVRYRDPTGHFFEELGNWLSGKGWNSNADINIKNNVIDLAYEAIHSDKDIKDFDLKVEKNKEYSVVSVLNKGKVDKKIFETNSSTDNSTAYMFFAFTKKNTGSFKELNRDIRVIQFESIKPDMEKTAIDLAKNGKKVIFDMDVTKKDIQNAFDDEKSTGLLFAGHGSENKPSIRMSDNSEFIPKDIPKGHSNKNVIFHACNQSNEKNEGKWDKVINGTFKGWKNWMWIDSMKEQHKSGEIYNLLK